MQLSRSKHWNIVTMILTDTIFQMVKLEASHPLVATTNNGVVTSGKHATGHVTDYYVILQNIVEYTLGDDKELRVVFFLCDWFDPINDIRMNNFGMVEVKHELYYLGSNLLLAHQAQHVYYLSYPHPRRRRLSRIPTAAARCKLFNFC
jgi:hypothetical protein